MALQGQLLSKNGDNRYRVNDFLLKYFFWHISDYHCRLRRTARDRIRTNETRTSTTSRARRLCSYCTLYKWYGLTTPSYYRHAKYNITEPDNNTTNTKAVPLLSCKSCICSYGLKLAYRSFLCEQQLFDCDQSSYSKSKYVLLFSQHLSYTGRISEWMTFVLSPFVHRKRITEWAYYIVPQLHGWFQRQRRHNRYN